MKLLSSLVLILILITGCSSATITQTQTSTETIFVPLNKTVTETATETTTQPPITITTTAGSWPLTFSHGGNKITNTFVIESSPWILEYSTQYTGHISIALQPYYNLLIVNNAEVVEGEVYQVVMEGYTGYSIYIQVMTNMGYWSNGKWTITVKELGN
ncbi:hypothetical protein ACFLYB_07230 [Chloroflexota bacterium]